MVKRWANSYGYLAEDAHGDWVALEDHEALREAVRKFLKADLGMISTRTEALEELRRAVE